MLDTCWAARGQSPRILPKPAAHNSDTCAAPELGELPLRCLCCMPIKTRIHSAGSSVELESSICIAGLLAFVAVPTCAGTAPALPKHCTVIGSTAAVGGGDGASRFDYKLVSSVQVDGYTFLRAAPVNKVCKTDTRPASSAPQSLTDTRAGVLLRRLPVPPCYTESRAWTGLKYDCWPAPKCCRRRTAGFGA
jgi:hypothetical protein